MVSAGDSGSSKERYNATDPTVVLPPVQEMRSKGSVLGQYTYKGRRRNETLKPDAKAVGIKILCIAIAVGLFAWITTSVSFSPSTELYPPDSPPLLTAPEDPAPEAGSSAQAPPPGDTEQAPNGRQNGSEGATGSPVPGGDPGQPLPSCQDQEPSQDDSEPNAPSPAEEDPNGEVGMMEVNSSNGTDNDQENLK